MIVIREHREIIRGRDEVEEEQEAGQGSDEEGKEGETKLGLLLGRQLKFV